MVGPENPIRGGRSPTGGRGQDFGKQYGVTMLENSTEAEILIEMWRRQYNTIRPHSALGYRPPAPAALVVQPVQVIPVGLTL